MAKKVMMVSGTCPELIKSALQYHTLKAQDWAQVCWIHTDQRAAMATERRVCCIGRPDYPLQRQGAGLFAALSECDPDVPILLPVHLNPLVCSTLHQLLNNRSNAILTESFDYLAMQQALPDAWRVTTDSGGLQGDAPSDDVPLLREETERPAAFEPGYARIVKTIETSLLEF